MTDTHKPESRCDPHFKDKENDKLRDLVRVVQPERNQIRTYWNKVLGSITALYKLLLNHRKLIQVKV